MQRQDVEAKLAPWGEHGIGQNGRCRYNAEHFGEMKEKEEMLAELVLLREENRSLKVNQQTMTKQTNYRIHVVEMGKMQQKLSESQNQLNQVKRQMRRMGDKRTQNNGPASLPSKRAASDGLSNDARTKLSKTTSTPYDESAPAASTAATPAEDPSQVRRLIPCHRWLRGECKDSAAYCRKRGFLHELPLADRIQQYRFTMELEVELGATTSATGSLQIGEPSTQQANHVAEDSYDTFMGGLS